MSAFSTPVEEIAHWERLGEAAYDAMYQAHSRHAAKDAYDDARQGLFRALGVAQAAGLAGEAERLKARMEHVYAVWTHQFR